MVDYNNEKTISTPLSDVLKISILEKRDYVVEAIKKYHLDKDLYGKDRPQAIRSGLIALFYMVRAMFKQDHDKEELILFNSKVYSDKIKSVLEAFEELEDYLHTKNITKIDNRQTYDTTDTEEENRIKGL